MGERELETPTRNPGQSGARRRGARSGTLGDHAQGLFLHIPKTAGRSFTQLLRHETALGSVLRIYGEDVFTRLAEAKDYDVVQSHLPFPVTGVLRQPLLIFTFLREPVDRTISLFEYGMRKTEKRLYAKWRESGLQSPGDLVTRGRYANRQTAQLGVDFDLRPLLERFEAGELSRDEARAAFYRLWEEPDGETLARAKARLEQIQFVGITEAFDESLRLFGKLIGMASTPAARRVNTAPESERAARGRRYDERMLEAVTEANRLDQELYDFAVELFKRRYEDAFGETPQGAAPTISVANRSDTAERPEHRRSGREHARTPPQRPEADRDEPRRELGEVRAETDALRLGLRLMDTEAAERLKEIDALQSQVAAARLETEMMRSSRTWRLGRPFRAIANAFRRLRPGNREQ